MIVGEDGDDTLSNQQRCQVYQRGSQCKIAGRIYALIVLLKPKMSTPIFSRYSLSLTGVPAKLKNWPSGFIAEKFRHEAWFV